MLTRSVCNKVVESISLVSCNKHYFLNVQKRFRRRTLIPPPWTLPKREKIYSVLDEEDRLLMEKLLKNEREPTKKPRICRSLPYTTELPDNKNSVYSIEKSKRIGLIGKKIGMTLQWLTNGTRILCTLIHFPENHVIDVYDPEVWFKRSPIGKRKSFGVYGPAWNTLVGANNVESIFFTDAYRRIFERVNVPIKEELAGFICTRDAVVKPGTKLDVRHFNVGQHVMVSGKTIDWGFQGVMHRWGMKGQPERRTTKSHRRVGSIGSKGDARVWPGRRLPGHMGYEWRHAPGLQVIRINPIKQVMYVKGCVPGDIGETLLVKDYMAKGYRVTNPPFPTYLPTIEESTEFAKNFEELNEIHMVTSRDLYIPTLFRFNESSIRFTKDDETKVIGRDKSKAKLAKVKK